MANPIIKFIKKVCVQTAVYWGTPTNNGIGGYSYATPREIKVRWENVTGMIKTKEGDEIETDAEVIVQELLAVNGRIWLGTLQELGTVSEDSGAEYNSPFTVDSHLILKTETTPLFRSTTESVYTIKTKM